MGTWGTGPFDNDAAADFLNGLSRSPSRAVTRSLKAIGNLSTSEFLEIDGAAAGWAACELVALAYGYGAFSTLEDVVIDAIAKLKPKEEQRLLALEALPRIGKPSESELADLWGEAGDGSLLNKLLKDLRERLESASDGPRDIPKPKVGDVICFPESDESSELVVFQVVSSREALVFEDTVKETTEARGLIKTGKARRVITAINSLFHRGEVVGKSPVRKEFKENNLYADHCGTFHEYCLTNASGGKFTEVGYDEALKFDRWQRHELLSLLQIPRGTCTFRTLRSPDEREANDQRERKGLWLSWRNQAPGPFDNEKILDKILSGIEEEGLEAYIERYYANARKPKAKPDLDFTRHFERVCYTLAGLVAALRDKQFAVSFPPDFLSRFPKKPSKQLMPLVVEAAHLFLDNVIRLDDELRTEAKSLVSELNRLTETVRKALGDCDEQSKKVSEVLRESTRAFNKWYRKGFQANAQGNKDGAIACFEKALGEMVSQGEYFALPMTYCILMNDYAAVGRLDEAREAYDKLLKLLSQEEEGPHDEMFWNSMAWYLYEHGTKGEMPHALKLVDRSLRITSESGDVLDTKLRILLRMGKEAEAKALLSTALALNPKHGELKNAKRNWQQLLEKFG